jgi:hypothetical protein
VKALKSAKFCVRLTSSLRAPFVTLVLEEGARGVDLAAVASRAFRDAVRCVYCASFDLLLDALAADRSRVELRALEGLFPNASELYGRVGDPSGAFQSLTARRRESSLADRDWRRLACLVALFPQVRFAGYTACGPHACELLPDTVHDAVDADRVRRVAAWLAGHSAARRTVDLD